MFVRFVIHKNDGESGRRQGLFQALAELIEDCLLLDFEQKQHDEVYEWFRQNLKKPRSFIRSTKPHAKKLH